MLVVFKMSLQDCHFKEIGLLMVLHGIFLMIVGLILPKVELLVFLLILLLPLAAYITYGTWYAYHLEKQRKRRASH